MDPYLGESEFWFITFLLLLKVNSYLAQLALCEIGFIILHSYEHQKPCAYIEYEQLAFKKYVLKKIKHSTSFN